MPQVFKCAINTTHSYAALDHTGNGWNCIERNMRCAAFFKGRMKTTTAPQFSSDCNEDHRHHSPKAHIVSLPTVTRRPDERRLKAKMTGDRASAAHPEQGAEEDFRFAAS